MDQFTLKNMREYDAHAREWHSAMPGNVGHKYLEKPAMERELPRDLSGVRVLCIGVGSGEELLALLARSPGKIVGIDVSNGLLNIASRNFPEVEFVQMDMADLRFPDGSFDFIYSSLTFHYAKDWEGLLTGVNRVLIENGRLLFSAHNPEFWARFPATGISHENRRGTRAFERTVPLPGNITATYFNVADAAMIKDELENAGYEIERFFFPEIFPIEKEADVSERDAYLKLKSQNEPTPLFLVVKARKVR